MHVRGEILDDPVSLGIYATDASLYQILPVIVLIPKDATDVRSAVKIARDHGVAILPRGGGTSLAGQTVGAAMVLDFSKYMNQILEVNANERWARVQPGVVRDQLNHRLQSDGLHFAPDPATSSRANIGGMIGNNSSGTKSILYGKTVDHLISVDVLLSDGTELILGPEDAASYDHIAKKETREGSIYRRFKELVTQHESSIIQAFPKVMRRVQGYNLDEFAGKEEWNLAKLICGSEGTLGVILSATVRLEPLPLAKMVCVVHYNQMTEAIRSVREMLDFNPAAIEILD